MTDFSETNKFVDLSVIGGTEDSPQIVQGHTKMQWNIRSIHTGF